MSLQYDGDQYDSEQWDADPASDGRWLIAPDDGRTEQTLRVSNVVLTPEELTLTVRARTSAERSLLESIDDNAGAVATRTRANGTIDALDTAGGANTYTINPPIELTPPRIEREYVAEDVSRERTSPDTQTLEGEVVLRPQTTRAPVQELAQTNGTDVWKFDFTGGVIYTPRVSNIDQGATTSMTIIMDGRQAELFESVAAATAGATVQVVPDGQTFSRDTTPNDRQTVTITPPSSASDPAIPADDYVVTGWSVGGTTGQALQVDMEISTRQEAT